MERLVQVADQVREQNQRLLLVADGDGSLERLAPEFGDGGIDGLDDVAVVGACMNAAVLAPLDGHVREMVGVVARRRVVAVSAEHPVSLHEVLHPRLFLGRSRCLEGHAWCAELSAMCVFERGVADALYAFDTIGPGTSDAQ
jgi:hypothetical protein